MSERRNLCVLVADVIGAERLAAPLGPTEAAHAVERCINRIERAIVGNGGTTVKQGTGSIVATFERCDSGVAASCEMLERVLSLPPLGGIRLKVRIAVHYGLAEPGAESASEAVASAQRLLQTCKPGQALASATAVMLLTTSARHFAGAEPLQSGDQQGMEWPVFTIGNRSGQVTSLPPAARIAQRLRLRHQEEVMFVDEQRPIVLLGRELGNDIAIIDPRASRHHARIERRRAGFVLIDQSTNGCYVSIDGDAERCIKTGEVILTGSGRIGCGFSSKEIERDLIFFDIV